MKKEIEDSTGFVDQLTFRPESGGVLLAMDELIKVDLLKIPKKFRYQKGEYNKYLTRLKLDFTSERQQRLINIYLATQLFCVYLPGRLFDDEDQTLPDSLLEQMQRLIEIDESDNIYLKGGVKNHIIRSLNLAKNLYEHKFKEDKRKTTAKVRRELIELYKLTNIEFQYIEPDLSVWYQIWLKFVAIFLGEETVRKLAIYQADEAIKDIDINDYLEHDPSLLSRLDKLLRLIDGNLNPIDKESGKALDLLLLDTDVDYDISFGLDSMAIDLLDNIDELTKYINQLMADDEENLS